MAVLERVDSRIAEDSFDGAHSTVVVDLQQNRIRIES